MRRFSRTQRSLITIAIAGCAGLLLSACIPALGMPGSVLIADNGVSGYSGDVVSCAPVSATDCATGGSFTTSNGDMSAYVHEEFNGHWLPLTPLPGVAATGSSVYSTVSGLSCSTPGIQGNNCVAVGYTYNATDSTPFIEEEVNGHWALRVTLESALGTYFGEVSCTTPGSSGGNCVAVFSTNNIPGFGSGGPKLVTLEDSNGTWGLPRDFSGGLPSDLIEINASGISCTGSLLTGNSCVIVGNYTFSSGGATSAFILEEKQGIWSAPLTITDSTINAQNQAYLNSVSCAARTAGGNNCVAGGDYVPSVGSATEPYVVEEVNGVWLSPNTSIISGYVPTYATVSSVYCGPQTSGQNNCVVVGSGTVNSNSVSFVDEEVSGVWDPTSWDSRNGGTEKGGIVLELGQLGTGDDVLWSVSCATPSVNGNNCVTVGMHQDVASGMVEPLGFTESNGVWQAGAQPGLHQNDSPDGFGGLLEDVSCAQAAAGVPNCVATGYFNGFSSSYPYSSCEEQASTLSFRGNVWSTASPSPAPASGCPTPARNVSASPLPFGAAVNWDAPVDSGGVSIDHYEVAYSSDGGTTWSTNQSASGTSLNVTDLSPQHSYLFRIIPVNLEGRTGDVTESTSAVTPLSATVPGAPTSVVVTTTKSAVSASWKPPVSNGGAPITSYTCTLMFGYNNPSSFTQKTTGPTCSFTGLTDPANYGVVVSATNSVGTTSATIAFAPSAATTTTTPAPHRTTITCHKGKKTRRVTGLNPHCPTGYHR